MRNPLDKIKWKAGPRGPAPPDAGKLHHGKRQACPGSLPGDADNDPPVADPRPECWLLLAEATPVERIFPDYAELAGHHRIMLGLRSGIPQSQSVRWRERGEGMRALATVKLVKRSASLIGAIYILLASSAGVAQEGAPASTSTYLIGGLEYSPYQRAILELRIHDGRADGRLLPLLGDKTPPVNVEGTNPSPGRLPLRFSLPSGTLELSFEKAATNHLINWKAGDENHEIRFYRMRNGEFSEASKTIAQETCGPQYRSLGVEFVEGASEQNLDGALAQIPQLAQLQVTFHRGERKRSMTLLEALKSTFRERDDLDEKYFDVPIGMESYVVKALREHDKVFKWVNLANGDCGGAEVSYFVIRKDFLFIRDQISREKFQSYIDTRIREFASKDQQGRNWQFRLAEPRLTVKDLPVPVLNFKLIVYAASEVTRRKGGEWDLFTVNFSPGPVPDTTSNEYSVVVEVERLKSVRKGGSNSPPDESYFRLQRSEDDEGVVTTAMTSFFSRRDGGWCVYDREGYERTRYTCQETTWSAQ
jgi:hypothetical protein